MPIPVEEAVAHKHLGRMEVGSEVVLKIRMASERVMPEQWMRAAIAAIRRWAVEGQWGPDEETVLSRATGGRC